MTKRARQGEFGFMGWGGKRRGAGRKPVGERAGVPHAKRPRLAARYPVLVTMRLRPGLASLRADDTHELLRRNFAAATSADFRVTEYSVQSSRVGPGRCRPGPPTDPDVRNSRIRLLGLAGSLRAA